MVKLVPNRRERTPKKKVQKEPVTDLEWREFNEEGIQRPLQPQRGADSGDYTAEGSQDSSANILKKEEKLRG